MSASEFTFGSFALLPKQRLLLESGTPVALGSRAMDILMVLLERPGALVSKEELMERVWPRTIIGEDSLRVHIAGLRRVLRDQGGDNRYIVNVSRRGYLFTAPVEIFDRQGRVHSQPRERLSNLPASVTRLVGHDEMVAELTARLSQERVVTVVGTGGKRLLDQYQHGVWFIELTFAGEGALVPLALASALALEVRSKEPLGCACAALRSKKLLLVLDNSKHVADAATINALNVLLSCPDVRLMATSREPLGIPAEHVRHLMPLDVPPGSADLSANEALA